ncbi:hypothetical protein [Pseudomonas oryzihabitans]|uniref:hypothetical protein n=1 Tax=Pseudomonas oryzihabitans TaxID=47885 RepID=UPI0012E94A81|nr:hypothetical protein [Pseudomonas oryzihabitans]
MTAQGKRVLEFRYSLNGAPAKTFQLDAPLLDSPFSNPEDWRREVAWKIECDEQVCPLLGGKPVNPATLLHGDEPSHPMFVEFRRDPGGKWRQFLGGPNAYVANTDRPRVAVDRMPGVSK